MENYNEEKVKVTVNLTKEAARMLYQYAGDRNRGRFLSDLIVAQRRRDELEGQAVALEASQRPVEAAKGSAHVGRRGNAKKRR